MRADDEVLTFQGVLSAPTGIHVLNPAFDVTPHYYVSAIITEKGVLREPYQEKLPKVKDL